MLDHILAYIFVSVLKVRKSISEFTHLTLEGGPGGPLSFSMKNLVLAALIGPNCGKFLVKDNLILISIFSKISKIKTVNLDDDTRGGGCSLS